MLLDHLRVLSRRLHSLQSETCNTKYFSQNLTNGDVTATEFRHQVVRVLSLARSRSTQHENHIVAGGEATHSGKGERTSGQSLGSTQHNEYSESEGVWDPSLLRL